MKKNIEVLLIECAIPASDCNKDNYLFDCKGDVSYLILED
jgi:hypothetical protein